VPRATPALHSQLQQSFYTPEQLALQESVQRLIEEEVNPFVADWEAARAFPAHQVFKRFGEAGLLGITRDSEFGGQGLDYKWGGGLVLSNAVFAPRYQVAFLEALGHCASPGVAMAIGVQTDCSTPALANFGSDRLKRDYLAPALAGDMVTSIAVSEPGAGSDVAGLTTSARRVGGDLVINGTKMWITSGLQSDWACLLANTSEGPSHANKSLIVVPMDAPGIGKTAISKMGMHVRLGLL
jgi:citronellyl-CoA dehydrogenase